jgi:hypothetical protein
MPWLFGIDSETISVSIRLGLPKVRSFCLGGYIVHVPGKLAQSGEQHTSRQWLYQGMLNCLSAGSNVSSLGNSRLDPRLIRLPQCFGVISWTLKRCANSGPARQNQGLLNSSQSGVFFLAMSMIISRTSCSSPVRGVTSSDRKQTMLEPRMSHRSRNSGFSTSFGSFT